MCVCLCEYFIAIHTRVTVPTATIFTEYCSIILGHKTKNSPVIPASAAKTQLKRSQTRIEKIS